MKTVKTKKRDRLPDWELRLFNFLQETNTLSMEWGEFDCVIGLASGAVFAQTGVDLAAPFKGLYSDEKSAMKFLLKNKAASKGDDLTQALINLMDMFLQRAPKGNRHRGNIVLLVTEEGPGFGVRVGSKVTGLSRSGGTRLFRPPPGSLEWVVV